MPWYKYLSYFDMPCCDMHKNVESCASGSEAFFFTFFLCVGSWELYIGEEGFPFPKSTTKSTSWGGSTPPRLHPWCALRDSTAYLVHFSTSPQGLHIMRWGPWWTMHLVTFIRMVSIASTFSCYILCQGLQCCNHAGSCKWWCYASFSILGVISTSSAI